MKTSKKIDKNTVKNYITSPEILDWLRPLMTDDNAEFYKDGNIYLIYRLPPDDETPEDTIGLFIALWKDGCHIWTAITDKAGDDDLIRDHYQIGNFEYTRSAYEIIDHAKENMHCCGECGKHIGCKNLHLVGFAGKCCDECLPAARKKYEYPGWTC